MEDDPSASTDPPARAGPRCTPTSIRHASDLGSFDSRTFLLDLSPSARGSRDATVLSEGLTFIHELGHFLQAATTPYGFFLSQLDRLQNEQVRGLCRAYLEANPGATLEIPVRHWLAHARTRLASDLVERFVRPWEAVDLLRATLEGHETHPGATRAQGEAGLRLLDPRRPVPTRASGPACPEVPYEPRVIGGFQVCEFAATELEIIELHSAARAGESPSSLEPYFDRRVHTGGYDQLFKHVYDRTGFMGPERFACMCLALGDVALFTPVFTVFAADPSLHGFDWTDLHPGWRFLRALEVVEQVKPLVLAPPLDDYARFVDDLCTRCGWPTVSATLAAVSRFEPGSDLLGEMFRDACRLRRQWPMLFTHPNHAEHWDRLWAAFLGRYAPPLKTAEGVRTVRGSRAAAGAYWHLAISTMTRALMDGWSLDELVPEILDEEIAARSEGPPGPQRRLAHLDGLLDQALGLRLGQIRSSREGRAS